MARSTARKRALYTLYEADVKSQDIEKLLEERIASPGADTPLPAYAIDIVRGVAHNLADIDNFLNASSSRWTVARMGFVDRNILRIAAWEIVYNDEIPDKVAIDEALSLVKNLCDDGAVSFIHGLLSGVCHSEEVRQYREAHANNGEKQVNNSADSAGDNLSSSGFDQVSGSEGMNEAVEKSTTTAENSSNAVEDDAADNSSENVCSISTES